MYQLDELVVSELNGQAKLSSSARAITFAMVFLEHSQLAAMLRWLIPWL
jgi:hypothetical protein